MNTESAVEFPGRYRLHVALTVSELEASKRFCQLLLGVPPSKERPRYAKFEPVDPSLNLALNEVDGNVTVERGSAHFGVQVKLVADVHAAIERFRAAGFETVTEEATTCCYAVQDKVWVVVRTATNGRSLSFLKQTSKTNSMPGVPGSLQRRQDRLRRHGATDFRADNGFSLCVINFNRQHIRHLSDGVRDKRCASFAGHPVNLDDCSIHVRGHGVATTTKKGTDVVRKEQKCDGEQRDAPQHDLVDCHHVEASFGRWSATVSRFGCLGRTTVRASNRRILLGSKGEVKGSTKESERRHHEQRSIRFERRSDPGTGNSDGQQQQRQPAAT